MEVISGLPPTMWEQPVTSVHKLLGITLKGLNISKGAGKLVGRKIDVRTACVILEVSEEDAKKLHQTRLRYGQACNSLVPVVVGDTERKERLWQRFNLHRAAYATLRKDFPDLGSQLACNVIRSVSSMYKSWISNHPDFALDKEMELPEISFRHPVIHLDKNTITFSKDYSEASIYTIQGRVHVRLCPGKFQREMMADFFAEEAAGTPKKDRLSKLGECDLVWKSGVKGSPSRWELHIAVEKKLKGVTLEKLTRDEVMGVDVGENNIATLSIGRVFKAGKMKNDRDKYLNSRARFQRNDSKSAKQALRKASGREKRHVRQINNEVSSIVVAEAIASGQRVIVLEDLTHIRSRIRAGIKVRSRLHRWPFRELQQMIVDKAVRNGIEVIFVDPHYTSQICSHCGAIGSRQKHRFVCKNCGNRAHSDINASQNLQGLGYQLITQGLV